MSKKIILFGGAFDPPHTAHIRCAFEAKSLLKGDLLVFLPSGNSPHKQTKTPAKMRQKMLELAILEENEGSWPSGVEISDFDIRHRGKCFAYLTVSNFIRQYADDEIILLIGGDQAAAFSSWRNHKELRQEARVVAMIRPPIDKNKLKEVWDGEIVETRSEGISSTELRNSLFSDEKRKLVKNYMYNEVVKYIHKMNIYK